MPVSIDGNRRRSAVGRRAPSKAVPTDWRDLRGVTALDIAPAGALLITALLLGGSAEPLGQMALEILALLLTLLFACRFGPDEWRRSAIGWGLVLLVALVALVELIPLPLALWSRLPGHAPHAALVRTLGLPATARPLSLDPNATRGALLYLMPGLAMFIATLAAGRGARTIWVMVLLASSAVTVTLGSLQITDDSYYLYTVSNVGFLTGLFANHNHAADALLVAMALTASFWDPIKAASGANLIIGAVLAVLAVCVVLTASRFGLALLMLVLLLCPYIVRGNYSRKMLPILGAGLVLAIGVALALYNPAVQRSLSRFGGIESDARAGIWIETVAQAARYMPFGSGLGTFEPIYAAGEQPENMPRMIVNHAHNEYLELMLELGAGGVLLMVTYFLLLGRAAMQVAGPSSDALSRAGLVAVLVYLLHSTNEFPLRNHAALVTFALLNGLVFAAAQQRPSGHREQSVSL